MAPSDTYPSCVANKTPSLLTWLMRDFPFFVCHPGSCLSWYLDPHWRFWGCKLRSDFFSRVSVSMHYWLFATTTSCIGGKMFGSTCLNPQCATKEWTCRLLLSFDGRVAASRSSFKVAWWSLLLVKSTPLFADGFPIIQGCTHNIPWEQWQ